MLEVDIPSRGLLRLEYLVLDVNGTIARATLGIAVLGGEGLAAACLAAADVVAPSIESALDLLLYPRRLVATLRT